MSDVKVKYFIDYWKDLTQENTSIERELVHSILYNPKELIKEFIEEIERKKLSNSDNKKFFIDKINEFSKLELECLIFLKPTLKLVLQQVSNKNNYSYLLHLLNIANMKLEDFALGKNAVKELSVLLTNDSEIDKRKIKHLVNLIIFELMHKKYSKKTIAEIIKNIFTDYHIRDNGRVNTTFPHNIQCTNWDIDSNEYKVYQKKLQNYIDHLSSRDRIAALESYFDKKPEELRYVYQIKGLKGDNVNITIGDVQIYNPKTIRLFHNPPEHFNELFVKEINDNVYYCNGAVTVKAIDDEYAKQEALQRLENALDIVSSRYEFYKIPLGINTSQHFVIDRYGKGISASFSTTREFLSYRDSLELDNSEFDNLIYAGDGERDKILDIDKKLLESMHWKRKAIESNENSEKILWHWVALENIFNKKNQTTPKIIFDVVSKLLTKEYVFGFAWKHYHRLREIAVPILLLSNQEIELPTELKNMIGLNSKAGETVYLKDFIENIDAIKPYIDNNTLFFEQMEFLQDIFSDRKKCLDLIETFEKIFFEKLIYLYRIRNKIVHNAHKENNPIFPYYIDFIALVSAMSIGAFIDKRKKFALTTSEDIINNIIYDYDEFKMELKEKGTSILL